MARDSDDSKAVPTGRIRRFAKVAKMAGGMAGGMLAEGGRQWRAGNRPSAKALLLTPGNAKRVTEQLADMRGAAMKMGQMLSMDTGDLLPKELTDILARLRSDARGMPIKQLRESMVEAYGDDWESQFYGFDFQPIAAASIGQVHRCYSPDGREIVLKIQYPGVAQSIDSDVDNIAMVLRLSGLLPDGLDVKPLLEDAKVQLHEEADYLIEAKYLKKFGAALADDERFIVPQLLPELTTSTVLAMTYERGTPIEDVASLPDDERNRVMANLIELMLAELFDLKMVQTDPNFANYQYRAETGQVLLLDFGATRYFKATFVNNYKKLLVASVEGDESKLVAAAERLGYSMGETNSPYRALVVELFELALEPLCVDSVYDFAGTDIPARMSKLAESVKDFSEFWKAPPIEAVYFHRKLGGMFLLASRLKTRINVHQLIRHLI
jgi:predicted unusual protein kinase regulating ubiquinone biosynthesis (AarF/ABC1/UbiB family)